MIYRFKFLLAYLIFVSVRLTQLKPEDPKSFAFDTAYRDAAQALRFLSNYRYPEKE